MNTHSTQLADWYISKVCDIFNVVQNHRTIIIEYVIPWSFQNIVELYVFSTFCIWQRQYAKYLTTSMACPPTNQTDISQQQFMQPHFCLLAAHSPAYVGFFRIWVHSRRSPIDWLPIPGLKWEDQRERDHYSSWRSLGQHDSFQDIREQRPAILPRD